MQTIKHKITFLFLFVYAFGFAQTFDVERIDGNPATMTVNDPIIDENAFLYYTGFNSNQSATSSLMNINGPSVIRVPDWIPVEAKTHPDANYYMYFAHHGGRSIRMAWANQIQGPWQIFNMGFAPDKSWGYSGNYSGFFTFGDGVLDVTLGSNTGAIEIDANYAVGHHIASPDVLVDDVNQRIVMYFHGYSFGVGSGQNTYVATSKYGLNFNMQLDGGEVGHGVRPVVPGAFYFRTFEIEGQDNGHTFMQTFAYSNLGYLYKAPSMTFADIPATVVNGDDLGGLWNPTLPNTAPWWTLVPDTQNPLYQVQASLAVRPDGDFTRLVNGAIVDSPRHFAIHHDPINDRDKVYVLYTGRGDAPESVVLVVFDLAGLTEAERLDPSNWQRKIGMEELLIEPEEDWEGGDLPIEYSSNGLAVDKRQLRDPYLFRDTDGQFYLFYTGRGEGAIGVASLDISETIHVSPKVLLEAVYETTTPNQMNDELRMLNLLPTVEPYTNLGYTGIQNMGIKVPNSTFSLSGNDAAVDWILVDLLDASYNIVARRAGLVQRDGDVVEVNGIPMTFSDVPAGNYHLTLRHRNHLGVMTQQTFYLE